MDALVLGGNQVASVFVAGAAVFGAVAAIFVVECILGNFFGGNKRDRSANYRTGSKFRARRPRATEQL